jgi:hypothetical protein
MGNQYVLQTIHLEYLSGFRINPIDQVIVTNFRKRFLVYWAKEAEQINPPAPVILCPPIKIDMKFGLQTWFYQAEALQFCHKFPPEQHTRRSELFSRSMVLL